MDTAVEFEQAIGAADFKDPAVLATLRDALVRARHALRELNDPLPGESRADFEYRIDTLFFDSKAENAGNIGVDVPFDRLVDSGDVRESLTALYNAFYLHADRPEVFKNSLMRAADGGDWARVDRSGADTAEIRERYRLLNSPMRRVGRGLENNPAVKRAARLGTDDRHLFDKDFFSSYSVIRAADHPVSDFVRSTVSYVNVRYRKDAEQLDYAHSAQDYADLGAPLGELSREFQEPRVSGPLDDPTVKLTWREGLTLHDKSNSWTQAANERGVPTVDGVSLTTTKMLNAAQLLGLDHGQRELFLKGLMAWMLPGRDHSLYEIALGARIAGVGPIAEGRVGGMGPVDLYRRTLDWHGETGSVPKVPEPHQIHYQNLVRDARWITETRHNDPELVEVLDLVDKQRAQLESGIVTDGVPDPATGRIPVHTLHSWLERNGVDPLDPVAVRAAGETLSEAHLTAVAVYTIHIHPYMLNAMILDSFAGRLPFGVGDKAVGAQFRMALNGYVKGYLADLADGKFPRRMPIALRPIFHTGAEGEPLNSHSPVTPVVAQWLDADRRAETGNMPDGPKSLARLSADLATEQRDLAYSRISERVAEHLPQLLNEVLIHSDMLQDALLHFPTVGSPEHPVLVYRGDRGGVMGFVRYGHPTLAPRATTRETLSTSLDPQVAIDFIGFNPREGSAPTLVVYELTGKYARDISAFTVYPTAAEVLFPLGATMSRVTDAARIAEIRASLPDNLPPGCEIIVLEEV